MWVQWYNIVIILYKGVNTNGMHLIFYRYFYLNAHHSFDCFTTKLGKRRLGVSFLPNSLPMDIRAHGAIMSSPLLGNYDS